MKYLRVIFEDIMYVMWFILLVLAFTSPFVVGMIIAMTDNLTLKIAVIGLVVLFIVGIYVMSVVERVDKKK